MNAYRLENQTVRWITILIIAAFLALIASFGTMALDQMAGTQLTERAAASCTHAGGGGC